MRSKYGDYTPREAAYTIALGWIEAAYRDKTNDIDSFESPESFNNLVKMQLAKLYNRLLEQSGLDGTGLPDQ